MGKHVEDTVPAALTLLCERYRALASRRERGDAELPGADYCQVASTVRDLQALCRELPQNKRAAVDAIIKKVQQTASATGVKYVRRVMVMEPLTELAMDIAAECRFISRARVEIDALTGPVVATGRYRRT